MIPDLEIYSAIRRADGSVLVTFSNQRMEKYSNPVDIAVIIQKLKRQQETLPPRFPSLLS
jgi:hypothetical protein